MVRACDGLRCDRALDLLLADQTTVARSTYEEDLRTVENKFLTIAGQFLCLFTATTTDLLEVELMREMSTDNRLATSGYGRSRACG